MIYMEVYYQDGCIDDEILQISVWWRELITILYHLLRIAFLLFQVNLSFGLSAAATAPTSPLSIFYQVQFVLLWDQKEPFSILQAW